MNFFKKNLRKKEGLYLINLCDEAFLNDLESGKFTILVGYLCSVEVICKESNLRITLKESNFNSKPFIKNYPVCALFTVRLHSCSSNELTTLKTLIYQLDAALEK
jgi:hypothetical protein